VGNDTHFWPVFGVKVGSASDLLVDVVVDNDLGLLVDVGNGTQIGLFFGAKVGDVLLSL
jgi:hypothetical protein